MNSDIQIEHFNGNGKHRSFVLTHPIDKIVAVLLDEEPITFGIKGLDNDRFVYWSDRSDIIQCDADRAPLANGSELTVIYYPYVEWSEIFRTAAGKTPRVTPTTQITPKLFNDILDRLDALEAMEIDGNDIARQVMKKLQRRAD
jgi:hypothetical protein